MVSTVSIQKQRIRTQALQQISALSKTYRLQADTHIQKALITLPQYVRSKVICYYVSTKNEVDTIQLIKKELSLKRKHIIVPKIFLHQLFLYEISSFKDLRIGSYGIYEPNETCIKIDPSEIDAFIIPGIAFGKDGSRIGRGKGYYDRLLNKITVPVIGLAYNAQMYPSVPYSAKDRKVDIIITENHIYDLKNPSLASV